MKTFTYIFATLILAGCLFISSDILSKSLRADNPVNKNLTFKTPVYYNPNLLNTFNYIFPIYSINKEVCRKPAPFGSSFLEINPRSSLKGYQFKGFFENRQPTEKGAHFQVFEGNSIYKKGNSLILIPQSYTMPVSPSYNSEIPRVIIPKSN